MKILLPFLALFLCFLSACSNSPSADFSSAQAPTGAETPLFNAINSTRNAAGKAKIERSRKLDALAASEASRLAESGDRTARLSAIRSHTNYGHTAVLLGSLQDRGPATGAKFPDYWMKAPREKEFILGSWHRMGVGTAKSAAGDLVSIVIFGGM